MRLLPLLAGLAVAQEEEDWLASVISDDDSPVGTGEKVVTKSLDYDSKVNLLNTLHHWSTLSDENRAMFNHEGLVFI